MRVEVHSPATPDAVWSVMTDLPRWVDVLSGVIAVERLDAGDEFGVGTRWNETRSMFGRQETQLLEVVAVGAGFRYTVQARSGGTTYTSMAGVEPSGTGSCLWMDFTAEAGSFVGRVLAATVGRAFEPATKKLLRQDLQDIATAAQAA